MNVLPFRRRLPAVSTLRPQTDAAWRVYAHRAAYEGLRRAVLNAVRRPEYGDDYPELWADVCLGLFQRSLRLRHQVMTERVQEKAKPAPHLLEIGGLRVLDDLVSRPEHEVGFRAGCLLMVQATRTFLVQEEAAMPDLRRDHDGFIRGVLPILDPLDRRGAFMPFRDAEEAVRVLGRRAAANLAFHPGDEQESALVLMAFTLQRMAFAARNLGSPIPWLALCDAWGELVAEQPLAPLGRPLHRLGRGAVAGCGSLWSTVRAGFLRDGVPMGRTRTFEGWCLLVRLVAGTPSDDGAALATVLRGRGPAGLRQQLHRPLARQALRALARTHPQAAACLAAMAPSSTRKRLCRV